jgi:hypothetical protein
MDAIASRHGQKVAHLDLMLIDLSADPGETTDVSAAHPEIVQRLTRMGDAFRADLGDSLTGAKGSGRRAAGKE